MKGKLFALLIVTAVLAAGGGWFAARHRHTGGEDVGATSAKVYSCSMHPQVRSNKPGKCPICGMDLAPIGSGQGSAADGAIMLGSNVVNVIHVQTHPVERGKLVRTLRVAGTIDDDATRHRFVSAYIDGRIDKLFVNFPGAEVVAGQPLATFYSPMLLAAEQEYALLLAQKTNVLADHARLIGVAEQRLRRLGLTDEQIREVATKVSTNIHTQILAPVSGTVVQRFAYQGQYVKEGEKLFEIADFAKMWFVFDVYERDLAWLKVGETVEVTTPSVPGKVYRAPITFIDPNLDEITRSAKVRVELDNPVITRGGITQRELLHKTYADGIVAVEIPDVLVIPRSAVLFPERRPIVYVEKSYGAYEQRLVRLGRAGDQQWEVLDGLNPGERVVTSGNMLIDAQAHLNRGGESPSQAADKAQFTAHQQQAVKVLLTLAHNLAAALAEDDVARFSELTTNVSAVVQHITEAFTDAPDWNRTVSQVAAAARLQPTRNLKDARRMFLPFADSVAELARAARQQPGFAEVRLFRCPMTDQAYPGAPKTALWIQTNAPLRNPYFGSEMIDCGSEIK